MEIRHAEQIRQMIGKKVSIYIGGKRVERVLRQDFDGLYIRFEKERVDVRPDENTFNIICFIALSPKNAAAIKKWRERNQEQGSASETNDADKTEDMEVLSSSETKNQSVVTFGTFYLYRLRRAYINSLNKSGFKHTAKQKLGRYRPGEVDSKVPP